MNLPQRKCYSLYTRWRNESHPVPNTDPARGIRRLNSPDGAGSGALTVWVDEAIVMYPDAVDKTVHPVSPLPDVRGELPLGYYGGMVFLWEGVYFM